KGACVYSPTICQVVSGCMESFGKSEKKTMTSTTAPMTLDRSPRRMATIVSLLWIRLLFPTSSRRLPKPPPGPPATQLTRCRISSAGTVVDHPVSFGERREHHGNRQLQKRVP